MGIQAFIRFFHCIEFAYGILGNQRFSLHHGPSPRKELTGLTVEMLELQVLSSGPITQACRAKYAKGSGWG